MKIILFDGSNWFRRRIETDITGRVVSNCFYEIQNTLGFPIIIWDGFNALERRRKIYPEYKQSRKPAGESIYESQDLLRKVLTLGKGVSIRVEGYEADDVIAHIARQYTGQGYDVFIESNDADLAQLGLPMARGEFHVPPHWIALYKTVVGDPSDNIKGAKGFGRGTWEKFEEKDLQLLEAVVCSYVNESEERVGQHLDKLPLPKAVNTWMRSKENRKHLLNLHRIVKFMAVPQSLIDDNTQIGMNKPNLAEQIFKEYMI